jgi:ATP-dependent DNA helicase RecQ
MYRTGQRFGAGHLIDVLRGRVTDRMTQWDHDKLSVFGIGADLDDDGWRNVFRQLVALGFARPDHEAYGALRLTEQSRAVLKGEKPVEMRRTVARARGSSRKRVQAALPAGADEALLGRLKAWRANEAREQSVPAYVIFHDSTLAAIAAEQPEDLTALATISGIGAKKLERYGPAVLSVIRG